MNPHLNYGQTSPHGKGESKQHNNHGTYYDTQVACFTLFTGQPEIATLVLSTSGKNRIASQLLADGSQPHELERTRSWDYSVMNLQGMFNLATLGQHAGVDLWSYQSETQTGMRRALDWMLPFASAEQEWTHQQISPFEPGKLAPLLRRASLAYNEPAYEKALNRSMSPKSLAAASFQLEFPANP